MALNKPNLQPFLDRLTSRSVLTDEEQQAVLNLSGDAEQVQSNRDFVPLGTRVDHACLVVAGIVGRFDQSSEGARQIRRCTSQGICAICTRSCSRCRRRPFKRSPKRQSCVSHTPRSEPQPVVNPPWPKPHGGTAW